jgi:hypothetical protein
VARGETPTQNIHIVTYLNTGPTVMTFTHMSITLYSLAIITSTFISRSQDSVVGIATGYGLGGGGVRV